MNHAPYVPRLHRLESLRALLTNIACDRYQPKAYTLERKQTDLERHAENGCHVTKIL